MSRHSGGQSSQAIHLTMKLVAITPIVSYEGLVDPLLPHLITSRCLNSSLRLNTVGQLRGKTGLNVKSRPKNSKPSPQPRFHVSSYW
jgi:hypothetical protein